MSLDDDIVNEAFEKMASKGGTWHLRRCLGVPDYSLTHRYLTLDPDKSRQYCEHCEKHLPPIPPRGAA